MPVVSEFAGIEIYFYFNDHVPPHFHAKCNGAEALIGIEDNCVLKGSLPSGKMKLVLAWSELHRDELKATWEMVQNLHSPGRIKPLS